MKRSASAIWHGGIKDGQGMISTESGALSNLPYSFSKRFGDEKGTNPEELIGAAHSSCFAMALSAELSKQNVSAESIDVRAQVSLEKQGESWGIPAVHLVVSVTAPGVDKNLVELAAKSAKANCPISKLLKANITMEFSFASEQTQSLH
jgi:osmotically inducible protein OsmC